MAGGSGASWGKPRISESERKRREEQSRADKAASQMNSSRTGKGKPQPKSKAKSKAKAQPKSQVKKDKPQPKVTTSLLYNGLREVLPTRVDGYHSMASFLICQGSSVASPATATAPERWSDNVDNLPVMAFLPTFSLNHLWVLHPGAITGTLGSNAFCVLGGSVVGKNITNSTETVSSTIGRPWESIAVTGRGYASLQARPDAFHGTAGRVLHGKLHVRISCHPSTQGYLVVRSISSAHIGTGMKVLVDQGLADFVNPGIKRFPIASFRNGRDLHAGLEDRGAYADAYGIASVVTGTTPDFLRPGSAMNRTVSPFYMLLLAFEGVAYPTETSVPPRVEIRSSVHIQVILDTDMSHLSNVDSARSVEPHRAVDAHGMIAKPFDYNAKRTGRM